jgi:hypothetical protein
MAPLPDLRARFIRDRPISLEMTYGPASMDIRSKRSQRSHSDALLFADARGRVYFRLHAACLTMAGRSASPA